MSAALTKPGRLRAAINLGNPMPGFPDSVPDIFLVAS